MIEDMGDFGSTTPPPPPPGEQPAAPKSRSKARGVAAGVGVALVVAAGGGALAASSSTGSTPSASPGGATSSEGAPPPGGEGPMTLHRFGGPRGFGVLGGPLGDGVVHGTFVVPKSGGGYETEQVQTGTVASVSATSIQITSKDGFKADYVVPKGAVVGAERDGIGSVKKGDEVTVSATVSGSTATVNRLMDITELKAHAGTWPEGPKGFGFGGPGGPDQRGPKSGSSASPTAPPTNS